jgi:sodium/pantothenate symporter
MADYLEDRFQSKALRGLSALFTLLFLIPFLGAQTIGAGAIVNTFTGAPFWVGVVIMGIGVTIYCSLGGIRGAMYTNILQGILMVITAISLFFAAIHLGGGLSAVNQRLLAADAGAFRFLEAKRLAYLRQLPFSTRTLELFHHRPTSACHQVLLMKNNKALYGSMIAAGVGMFLSTFFIYSTGVIARDVLPGVPRNLIDWVVPAIAAKTLPAVFASILMGGILAAGMSTIDSVVVVVGGALSRDIYQKLINPKASDEDVLKLSRICVVLVGCLATLLGIARPAGIFQIVLFTFAGLGIQAIVMILGVRWKRANWQGATAGLLVGLISVIYFATHPQILPGWNAALPGGLACLIVMVIVSLLTSPTPEDVIKRHFTL